MLSPGVSVEICTWPLCTSRHTAGMKSWICRAAVRVGRSVRCRLLGRTHLLSDGICVATCLVDSIVLQQNALHPGMNASDRHEFRDRWTRLVDIGISQTRPAASFFAIVRSPPEPDK
jgi:hypothetical protein